MKSAICAAPTIASPPYRTASSASISSSDATSPSTAANRKRMSMRSRWSGGAVGAVSSMDPK
jgi:hypothetical protein